MFKNVLNHLRKIFCIVFRHNEKHNEGNMEFCFRFDHKYDFTFYYCKKCKTRYFGCKDSTYDILLSNPKYKPICKIIDEYIMKNDEYAYLYYREKIKQCCKEIGINCDEMKAHTTSHFITRREYENYNKRNF